VFFELGDFVFSIVFRGWLDKSRGVPNQDEGMGGSVDFSIASFCEGVETYVSSARGFERSSLAKVIC